jgi:hypothetical protein
MIGVSRNATLDEVIAEVQQIEEILYCRAKGQRLADQLKQVSLQNAASAPSKRYNVENIYPRKISSRINNDYFLNSYSTKVNDYQSNTLNRRNEVTSDCYPNNRYQITTDQNMNQQMNSFECYSCGRYGH